jgi:lambda repressor-like predicted transcriptional regulator
VIIFRNKQQPAMTRADAMAELRDKIAAFASRAVESGVDRRDGANELERQADLYRQRDAMMRAVL